MFVQALKSSFQPHGYYAQPHRRWFQPLSWNNLMQNKELQIKSWALVTPISNAATLQKH
jgi:hypothetical protein